MSTTEQQTIDTRNAAFWDELCGTTLAQTLGVTDHTPASLKRFDDAYMGMYPYLPRQLPESAGGQEPLLEIGLGYGTVGQILAERGFAYHGLDIAPGPVEMMRARLRMLGQERADERVRHGSALEIPHPADTFQHVVSIGCLHHTGDLARSIREVHRVLRPGGTAMVMLYNRHSLRQLKLRWSGIREGWNQRGLTDEKRRAAYDANSDGQAAPETVFVTARQVREELFSAFSEVRIERHNFDPTRIASFGGRTIWLTREQALPTIARLLGLDLYIHARK